MNSKTEKTARKGDSGGKYLGTSKIIERNIRTISELRTREAQNQGFQEKMADKITLFSGRMLFVYVHILWFGLWVFLNSGVFGLKAFDPFPYGLLTMIVSLESIFLSTFVLISQNRISAENMTRAELDMHISLLTEHELTQALHMLHSIERKLGTSAAHDDELPDLEKEIRPEDVLAEINRLQQIVK